MEDQEFDNEVTYTTAKYDPGTQPPIKFRLDPDSFEPEFMTSNGDVYRFNGKQWVKIESEDK